MSGQEPIHLPHLLILPAPPPRDREAARGLGTTAPRRPLGAGGGAEAWRAPRRRERKSESLEEAAEAESDGAPGNEQPRAPVPPPSALGAGGRGVHFSPHTWDWGSFPSCLVPVFSPHVTRGAGPRLGRRLLGRSRPSTPEGFGLRGHPSRPSGAARAAVPSEGPRPKHPRWRGRSFPGFQQVPSGSVATQGYGAVRRRGHPGATPGCGWFPGREPWAEPPRCPGAAGYGLGEPRRPAALPGVCAALGARWVRTALASEAARPGRERGARPRRPRRAFPRPPGLPPERLGEKAGFRQTCAFVLSPGRWTLKATRTSL